jgi:peptidoglycan/xylan/chitin deacetylase (PgdA/CDA1 family)
MKFILLVTLIIVTSAFLIIYIQPRFLLKWIARKDSQVLYFVQTEAPVIALTIDDGPHQRVTPKILEVLREKSARATFFLIGERIKGNENILDLLRTEGHELGNHLTKDYPSILLSPQQFKKEILDVDKLIKPHGPFKWIRPGSGFYNKRMLRQIEKLGYTCSLGSVYPHDTIVHSVFIISTFIAWRIFPGAVVILHEGRADRIRIVEILGRVLPVLRQKGYKIVTLSELMKHKLAMKNKGRHQ